MAVLICCPPFQESAGKSADINWAAMMAEAYSASVMRQPRGLIEYRLVLMWDKLRKVLDGFS